MATATALLLALACTAARPLGAAAASAADPVPGPTSVPVLRFPSPAIVAARGAASLDGSPPAFYWRAAQPGSEGKIRIHLRGGAWCMSESSCLARANSTLGSSKYFGPLINETAGSDD
jgi:O-palmitoleoyl-L-serine hydrolase